MSKMSQCFLLIKATAGGQGIMLQKSQQPSWDKVLSRSTLQFILLQVSKSVCNIPAFQLLAQILFKY